MAQRDIVEKKPKPENSVIGRPTKYDPKYCDMLIEHMASGLSFLSFAAVIDVAEDTIVHWCHVHPAFSVAKKEGFSKNRLFWEKLTKAGAAGKIKNFNPTMAIFQLKNRFPKEWRDRQEHTVEHSQKVLTIETETAEIQVTASANQITSTSE